MYSFSEVLFVQTHLVNYFDLTRLLFTSRRFSSNLYISLVSDNYASNKACLKLMNTH